MLRGMRRRSLTRVSSHGWSELEVFTWTIDEEPEPEVDLSALMNRQRLDETQDAIGVPKTENDDDVCLSYYNVNLTHSNNIHRSTTRYHTSALKPL
jgi:hypothetical protein